MSFHNSQCKKMHCRSKRSNNMAWAAIVAFGILGAAVAEGVSVASLATRSRDLHTTPTHVDMRPSSQDREGGDPSQCTADLIHPGNGDPAEVQVHIHSSPSLHVALCAICKGLCVALRSLSHCAVPAAA